jgi:predicted permease
MSMWSRLANVFRGDRLNQEIDAELESHIEEGIAQGRDPAEARRALGSALRLRERSRDVRLLAWLDALRADAVFASRRLRRNGVSSAAAILSLALAMGACTCAFRIIDALLLRPLPVTSPGELHVLARRAIGFDGEPRTYRAFEYPLFRQMRAAVGNDAELLAISQADRVELTYKSDQEMEKAYQQYVSGRMFESFGLRPAAGRLLTDADDRTPGAHPYAVISYDYWTRRFARDPGAIGRTFHAEQGLFEIVGVAPAGFAGTETGTMTDIFVPMMSHPGVDRSDWTWFRTWVRLPPASPVASVRDRMQATLNAFLDERVKGNVGATPQHRKVLLEETLVLEPAASGASDMQTSNRRALVALGVLVALVLLIACANVANLMTTQAAARAREMALRVSIGAGRARLVQLVLVESAVVACVAAALGGLFAWWAAPFVVSLINPPDNPARLSLPADWRVAGFGLALTLGVTALFGLAPALRASAIRPVAALKGGSDPHARRRLTHALIAAQVAFCVLVLFVAGLFVASFDRLSTLSPGFSADRLVTLDVVADAAQPPAFWDQAAAHLRALPGVETVALAGWPLLNGNAWNGFVSIDGAAPNNVLAFFLNVSPGWVDAMQIPLVSGRDFRATDTTPGAAIVNETFVKTFFNGQNPVGRTFAKGSGSKGLRFEIVGVVRDVRYRSLREAILPQAYVPFQALDAAAPGTNPGNSVAFRPERRGTFIVRTTRADPLALAAMLRQEVPRARPEFRVSNIRTQLALNQSHTVRERLLAMLATFFALVALGLAGVGLYGVLHYSVLQRRREIGIRIALGARAGHVARGVTAQIFTMVIAGAVAGIVMGLAAARYIETLFYQTSATDASMLALPSLLMLAVAAVAALPAVRQAVRIDPVRTLRAE